ncbi:MAG: hypothetical protein WA395_07420 [Nitrososphaeraceae archaeon]|jgi:hypothetical protein
MNSKIIGLMIIVSIISAGLLIVAIGIDTDNSALAKKYKKTQTLAQLNNCGNQLLPTNITCANYNSYSEGHENYNSVGATNPSPLPFP